MSPVTASKPSVEQFTGLTQKTPISPAAQELRDRAAHTWAAASPNRSAGDLPDLYSYPVDKLSLADRSLFMNSTRSLRGAHPPLTLGGSLEHEREIYDSVVSSIADRHVTTAIGQIAEAKARGAKSLDIDLLPLAQGAFNPNHASFIGATDQEHDGKLIAITLLKLMPGLKAETKNSRGRTDLLSVDLERSDLRFYDLKLEINQEVPGGSSEKVGVALQLNHIIAAQQLHSKLVQELEQALNPAGRPGQTKTVKLAVLSEKGQDNRLKTSSEPISYQLGDKVQAHTGNDLLPDKNPITHAIYQAVVEAIAKERIESARTNVTAGGFQSSAKAKDWDTEGRRVYGYEFSTTPQPPAVL